MTELLFLLVMSHFVCDYVFQTDAIATGKNRNIYRAKFGVDWYYWMTAHAATHALGVYFFTGSALASLLEFISHWAIDAAKCEKMINLHADQALHIAVKIIIVLLFAGQS